ncbi:hypothetical protein, partial [Pseudonocardia benzenivorans]|uniref:hypothetical protein n=1 Tax=Pseudonocardia benzenivorans TaxID=228005 RepID=UPI0031F7F1BC
VADAAARYADAAGDAARLRAGFDAARRQLDELRAAQKGSVHVAAERDALRRERDELRAELALARERALPDDLRALLVATLGGGRAAAESLE